MIEDEDVDSEGFDIIWCADCGEVRVYDKHSCEKCENEEEEAPNECDKCGSQSFKYSTEICEKLGDGYYCCECINNADDDEEEEEDYKNYGVLAVGEDCEEDFGFFDTIEEAIVEYKKVSLIDYMRVVIFESENYNPDEDNVGTVPIVKSRTKKVKKQIKLKLKK